jgi:hypothetical protein
LEKTEEKDCILGKPETGDPSGLGWGVGFYSLFALPDGGDAFQMQTGIS